MLFHSSLRKELARSFGASLIVLVTVVMTMTLIRTLGQASRGSFSPSDVMMVMGYTVLTFLPNVMTMALFIATVSTLTRLYRDSEMVIWFGSGVGLLGLVRPLFHFAWPILLAIATLALAALPWANEKIEGIRDHYEQRGDLDRVEPGRFQESADGRKVFFVDKNPSAMRAANSVFIATTDDAKETVTTAGQGRIENRRNDQFLVLSNGQRLESSISKQELRISEFVEYGTKVGTGRIDLKDNAPLGAVPSLDLLRQPTARHLGELTWRLGFALAAANLVIIGLASSRINPRVGRTGNLVFSLFAFQIYLNLLNLGQSWVAQKQIGAFEFLVVLHGGVALLALAWLAKRHHNWGLWLLYPRLSKTVDQAKP
jgi:lipopolysaccharide export system permease protein